MGQGTSRPAATSSKSKPRSGSASAVRKSRNGPAAEVVHLTPEERAARGKAARSNVPRSSHAEWDPPTDRADPISLLEEQAKSRVPELVPIRYGRMLVSPFTFYRGAALVMASDLSSTPRSGMVVQACGDAHLSNFGVFGSPERELLFDINDFDETLPGPWEWDVKRLAASLAIAGRNNGFTKKERNTVVGQAVHAYRTAMTEFAGMTNLDVWYARVNVQEIPRARVPLDKKNRREAEKLVAKARTRDSLQAFDRLTHLVDGEHRIIRTPPVIVPLDELIPDAGGREFHEALHDVLRSYRRSLVGDRRHLLDRKS